MKLNTANHVPNGWPPVDYASTFATDLVISGEGASSPNGRTFRASLRSNSSTQKSYNQKSSHDTKLSPNYNPIMEHYGL